MGRSADDRSADEMKADGSEPGGGVGMENIERSAGDGIRTDHASSEERRVEQLAAGVGDTPEEVDTGRRERERRDRA